MPKKSQISVRGETYQRLKQAARLVDTTIPNLTNRIINEALDKIEKQHAKDGRVRRVLQRFDAVGPTASPKQSLNQVLTDWDEGGAL